MQFRNLEVATYEGFFFNPSDGTEHSFGEVQPDAAGAYRAPEFPILRDWVIVLQQKA